MNKMTEKPTEPLIDNKNDNDDDEVVIIPYVKPPPPLVILESDDEEELSKDLEKMRLTSKPHSKPLQPTGAITNQMSSSTSTKNSGAKDRTTQTKSNDTASTTIIFFFPKGRLRNTSVSEMLKFLTGLEKEHTVKIQPRTNETEGRGSISISGGSSAVSNARIRVQQWLKEKSGNVLNSDQNKDKENQQYNDDNDDEEEEGEESPVCMRTRKQQKRKDEAEKTQEASVLIDLRLCRNANEFELLMKRLRHVVRDLYVILRPRMEYNGLRVTVVANKMESGLFPPPERQQTEISYAVTRLQTWINMALPTH